MKIKSIKKNGVKPTWDLSIPVEEHYILKNGCVSHNTSSIVSMTEGVEPFSNLIVKRIVDSGEFAVINKHLLRELEDIGLWCNALKNEILEKESLKDIVLEKYTSKLTSKIIEEKGFDYITQKTAMIKRVYKTVWDLKAKPVINMAAGRQPFVDQTQSMNLWMENPNGSKLTSMHLYAWNQRVKTGIYYLKLPPATAGQKSLGGVKEHIVDNDVRNNDIECVGCSV